MPTRKVNWLINYLEYLPLLTYITYSSPVVYRCNSMTRARSGVHDTGQPWGAFARTLRLFGVVSMYLAGIDRARQMEE